MKLKKTPRDAALFTLTFGASTILGFLSFSGMFALWPILPLAFASMVLSVAYEGEIYIQNIQSAFKKLFQPQFNERQAAREFLLKYFPHQESSKDRPQFFADYEAQLHLVQKFSSHHLDKASRILKKRAQKKLSDMEKWFAKELFRPVAKSPKHATLYQTELRTWFKTIEHQLAKEFLLKHVSNQTHSDRPQFFKAYETQRDWVKQFSSCHLDQQGQTRKKEEEKKLSDMEKFFTKALFRPNSKPSTKITVHQAELQAWLKKVEQKPETYLKKLQDRYAKLRYFKAFSVFAAVFMSLGTTYLLTEAFSVIPFLATLSAATLPFIVFPMALIAGVAYGFLTYNSVTDLFFNKTGKNWFTDLKKDLSNFFQSKQSALKAMGKITLAFLALTLTIFTAGTWLTVVQETRPLVNWMRKIPGALIGASILIVDFFSALAFNLQNSAETLELVAGKLKTKTSPESQEAKHGFFKKMLEKENPWQLFNPFRIVLKLTVAPIRVILFLGHLVSIGVTADRVPGVSQFFSALLGIISEGFEDAHYFLPHSHHHHEKTPKTAALLKQHLEEQHEHSHDNDLPTRLIKFLFAPVYLFASGWDYMTSQLNASNDARRTLSWNDAWKKQNGLKAEKSVSIDPETKQPSIQWQKQHTLYLIEAQRKRLKSSSLGAEISDEKRNALKTLKETLKSDSVRDDGENAITDAVTKNLETHQPTYARHRLFGGDKTQTIRVLEALNERTTSLRTL